MADRYDVVVIGGGPGGYVASIRAAQLGLKTACVESRGTLGGTCLNIGCIPSKALLQSSHKFAEAKRDLAKHGVKVGEVALDLVAMMDRKDKVVSTLTRGVEFLFRKNKIDWLKGEGRIAAPGRVVVTAADGTSQAVEAASIVIATGSETTPLRGIEIDEQRIVSSTGALALDRVPDRLAVIGGGYIGLELGSVWQRLGAKVTVVEVLDRIVPNMDRELGSAVQRVLARSGIEFRLGAKVAAIHQAENELSLELDSSERQTLAADVVLVSVGRRPYTEGLGLEAAGVALPSMVISWSMTGSRRISRASMPSVTWSAGRCSRTRPWMKAWHSPNGSPGSTRRSITMQSRRWSTPRPRSPRSAEPKKNSKL
jgi:dihydrolipoamide dehydrogenase